MECQFVVGQKVVCVKDTVKKINDLGLPGYSKGQILTISDVVLHDGFGCLPKEDVFLKFFERGPRSLAHHSGFSPVIERKTDISIFTDMLNKQHEPA